MDKKHSHKNSHINSHINSHHQKLDSENPEFRMWESGNYNVRIQIRKWES